MLFQVEEHLIPALNNYLDAMTKLQAIFQQFNMQCRGIKHKLEQTDGKLKQEDTEVQLKALYNGLKSRGQVIGDACNSSVNLYNNLKA